MILMNDFCREPEDLKQAMKSAAFRVIDSGWFVLGKEATEFERVWSGQCQSSYGIGVGNGMDAIEIILRSLEIGPGDEVITTSMTAFATVLAILRSGATPVLADIEISTGLMSISSAKRCLSKKTKAILLVHLYGQLRDMEQWTLFCDQNCLFLVEDCAQSHLASASGKRSGSFGVAGAFSFYPTKNLGALGDAGMVVTDSDKINDRARMLRNYGQSERYHHPTLGMNSRLDEIQAAMLLERNEWLKTFTDRRREIAQKYFKYISNKNIHLLDAPQSDESHDYHLFVLLSKNRDFLQKNLEENGIQSFIHYPIPAHKQLPLADCKHDSEGLGNCEVHAKKCLSIPCHPQMTDDDVMYVVETLNRFKCD